MSQVRVLLGPPLYFGFAKGIVAARRFQGIPKISDRWLSSRRTFVKVAYSLAGHFLRCSLRRTLPASDRILM